MPDHLQPQTSPGSSDPTGAPAAQPALLQDMKANPRADWTIRDVKRLSKIVGLVCTEPSGGSHYKVSSSLLEGILTVPFNRPIKPVYIKKLVSLASAHLAVAAEEQNNG